MGKRRGEWVEHVNGGEIWTPKREGDSIEGEVSRVRAAVTRYGPGRILDLETEKGVIGVFLSASLLDAEPEFTVGRDTRITFTGVRKTKKGRTCKQFSLAFRE